MNTLTYLELYTVKLENSQPKLNMCSQPRHRPVCAYVHCVCLCCLENREYCEIIAQDIIVKSRSFVM